MSIGVQVDEPLAIYGRDGARHGPSKAGPYLEEDMIIIFGNGFKYGKGGFPSIKDGWSANGYSRPI